MPLGVRGMRHFCWSRYAARLQACLPWLVALVTLTSACLPPQPLSPIPLPTSTETTTVTPTTTTTIVWFPPTATFTLFPTAVVSPTENFQPNLGPLILEDDYTDQGAWPTMRSADGSVAYGNQELTLAVAVPGGALVSLRQAPLVNDFYLEIDAMPSLCRSNDTYGLLLRASSILDFYRLMVNCNGQLRVERLKNGYAVLIQDWTPSGQIPPGGMMRTRLGVWSLNDEMRVFVNGIFQFSFRDPVWTSGQIGVFARSAGDTPMTVNFSNLSIYRLSEGRLPPPTPTARPATKTPPVVSSQTSAPPP